MATEFGAYSKPDEHTASELPVDFAQAMSLRHVVQLKPEKPSGQAAPAGRWPSAA